MGSGSVTSGSVASGAIHQFAYGSGTIQSGQLATITAAVASGNIASGSIGQAALSSGAIQSGQLSTTTPPVSSGNVASGQLGTIHITSGGLLSGTLGSGSVTGQALGPTGPNMVIASGSISPYDVASGTSFYGAVVAGGTPWVSGAVAGQPGVPNPLQGATAEVVSGPVAVCFNQSGQLQVAMASISGRQPAIGIALGNAFSGKQVPWAMLGAIQYSSGMAFFSGWTGTRAWLGRSGQIVQLSGSWASGGWASGDMGQPIGQIVNSGGIVFHVSPIMWSGGPLGLVNY